MGGGLMVDEGVGLPPVDGGGTGLEPECNVPFKGELPVVEPDGGLVGGGLVDDEPFDIASLGGAVNNDPLKGEEGGGKGCGGAGDEELGFSPPDSERTELTRLPLSPLLTLLLASAPESLFIPLLAFDEIPSEVIDSFAPESLPIVFLTTDETPSGAITSGVIDSCALSSPPHFLQNLTSVMPSCPHFTQRFIFQP